MKTNLILAACLMGTVTFAQPAYANVQNPTSVAEIGVWKSKKVRHADLDLSSTAGREQLQLRIKRAVKQVCGARPVYTLRERQNKVNCQNQANFGAVQASTRIIAAYMEKRSIAYDRHVSFGTN